MIARIWHGYTTPENADAYEAMLKPEPLPGLGKISGYRGSFLHCETAVVPEERRKYLSRFDAKSRHYEITSVDQLKL